MKINLNDSTESYIKPEKITKRIRRVRPLVKREPKEVKVISKPKRTCHLLVLSILVSISGVVLYQLTNNCKFWAAYEKNFNKLVYGDEYYCIRKINVDEIYEQLRNEVIAQNDAIELIRGSLEKANREGFVSAAFNGRVGTGKSLSADIISRQFRWKNNIQKYSWDATTNSTELIELINSKLSKCGYNLIIIDNVNKTSLEFVKEVDQMVHTKSKADLYRIVLIVIFKDTLQIDNDTNPLQEILKNFVIVDYHPFTLNNFVKCIEAHEKLYDLKISPEELDDLKELDYESTGCKLISKRLNSVK